MQNVQCQPQNSYKNVSFSTSCRNAAALPGEASNRQAVINQLDSIASPTSQESELLTAFATLSPQQQNAALDQMGAPQYTSQFFSAQIANTQFLRRLYDPLRPIITQLDFTDQTACAESPHGYYDPTCPLEYCGIDVWLEGGGSYGSFRGHGKPAGFRMHGNEIMGGAQYSFENALTIGLAGAYIRDYLKYPVGGKTTNRAVLGAAYALYRPDCYYLLADAIFGYSNNVVERHVSIGALHFTAHSHPNICESTFYAEIGRDYSWRCLLIQPFAGLELGNAKYSRLQEHGAGVLDLTIHKQNSFNSSSRLGVHLTAAELPWDFVLSLDLAWLCRISDIKNNINAEFQAFGSPFKIKGLAATRNSLEGIFNLAVTVGDNWSLFTEASGQWWQEGTAYTFLGGAETSW